MSDRLHFLRAIQTSLADDTVRLVFADWLEEYGQTDWDQATADFIRLACRPSFAGALPAGAGRWLDENWMRLLPLTVACHKPSEEMMGIVAQRTGRFIWVRMGIPANGRIYRCKARLEFHRGFLVTFQPRSAFMLDRLYWSVMRDQPLAECQVVPYTPPSTDTPSPPAAVDEGSP